MPSTLVPGEVARIRKGAGLTQEEFAHALGISVDSVQAWEQGRRSPKGLYLQAVRIFAERTGQAPVQEVRRSL
jgi:DNA-binding transcriptional regulator YiaG